MAKSVTRDSNQPDVFIEALEARELKPRFSVLAVIGIQYSISATPLAIGSYITFVLGAGGSPFFFYAFLVAAVGQLLVCTSMAEIASVFPHASGQVFWTAALSPPKWARFLSYWNGATTSLGWIFANTGTFVFTAQIVSAAVKIWNLDWEVQTYQVFLISAACAAVGLIINIWLFNYYPHITKFMVVFINLGTLYVLVALLARTNPKASAHTVFVDVINKTGWSSNGVVFLLCFLPGSVAISCFDTASHMSEEMDSPERQVPLVMMGASAMCAVTAIPMILVYLFCTSHPENLLEPTSGQPIFQVFEDGFRSPALLTIATIIYCICYLSSCPATIATGSRLIWSFAKHGGLPMPGWIGYVEPQSQIPVNAVYLTTVLSTLLSLLLFGPTTILNGVFGACSVCFFFSFGMPIWLSVLSGRKHISSTRYFNLGRFGMLINILAIAWQFLAVVFLCFPIYLPVTGTNMNWASLIAVVGLLVFVANWVFYAKKRYHSPKPLFIEGIHGHVEAMDSK
ncbi:amino acid transporter [Cadophora sp. DSE1049]|nr:amino acid transporter [Cadophora sp. DSE1049]